MSEQRVNTTHKIKATNEQIETMLAHYQGYLTYNASEYIIARAKLANSTITFYKTNTVLFQGEGETHEYNLWASNFNLPLEVTTDKIQFDYSNLSAIGSDEVGTGDYFGPIVVCATYVNANQIGELKKLGVKDSKLLTDSQIVDLGIKLAEKIPYSIMLLEPKKINHLSDDKANLNFIKAYLHNRVINSILKKNENVKYDAILVDEFTPRDKYFEYLKNEANVNQDIILIPKGERAHVAIAAASILARYTFLKQIKQLSNKYNLNILKGAGPEVDKTAILFVKNYGFNELDEVVKLKFANTARIKKYFLQNPLPKSKQGHIYE